MKKCTKSEVRLRNGRALNATETAKNCDFLRKIRDFSQKNVNFPSEHRHLFAEAFSGSKKTRFSTCATAKTSAKRTEALNARSALKAKMRLAVR